jgi:hypothetical protein
LPNNNNSVEPDVVASSSSNVLSSSSNSVEPEPSILDCPPEDIAEYPIPDEPIPPPPEKKGMSGWCGNLPKLSVKELSFGKQGGVRCLTTALAFGRADVINDGFCRTEFIVSPPPFSINKFRREICSWLTATKVDDRVLHISVNQNETGDERNMHMDIANGNCYSSFAITQSAE